MNALAPTKTGTSQPSERPDPVRRALDRVLRWAKLTFNQTLQSLLEQTGHQRVVLHRDASFEVVAIRWTEDDASALRGHGESQTLVEVLAGAVWEERYLPDGWSHRREIVLACEGDQTFLPAGALHRIESVRGAVTLHVHSPPVKEDVVKSLSTFDLPALLTLLDGLQDDVALLDQMGRVVHVNARAAARAGLGSAALAGRAFFTEVAPHLATPAVAGRFFEAVGREMIETESEVTYETRADPEPRTVVVRLRTFLAGGEAYGCVIVRDVTTQRSAGRMKELLGSLLVHDMKNPLSAVLVNLGMLSADPLLAGKLDIQHSLESAESSARRLERMILNLLDLTRLEQSELPLHIAPFDLAMIGEVVVSDARPLARLRNVHVELVRPGEPVLLRADSDVLRRVLDNLVDNAVRHARLDGNVQVRIDSDDHVAWLEVQDDGAGVSEALREQIFDKYMQTGGHDPRMPRQNRGLGLTFVRLAARAHGGEATVECPPVGGSIFRVEIPLRPM